MSPEATEALAGLRDIHLPDAVGFWPPASGWWLLAAVLLCWTVGRALFRRSQRRTLRSEARTELACIEGRYNSHCDPIELATDLSSLLRRVALACFDRDVVAGLHGEAWIDFLVRTSGSDADAFPREVGGGLTLALYAARPDAATGSANGGDDKDELPELDSRAWIDAVREWVGVNT